MGTGSLSPDPTTIHETVAPDPTTIKPSGLPSLAGATNPMDTGGVGPPGGPVISPVGGAALGGVLDIAARPQHTLQAGLTGGPGVAWQTLLHGQSPESINITRKQMREKFGIEKWYEHQPRAVQGSVDFAIDSIDPMNLLGVTGAERHLVESAVEHALPTAMKAGGIKLGATPLAETWLGKRAAQLHDVTAPGGGEWAHAARVQALAHGRQGVRNIQEASSAYMASHAIGAGIPAVLEQLYKKAVGKLKPSEQEEIFRAIHYGQDGKILLDRLPAHLQGPAAELQRVDRSILWLNGNKQVREWLVSQGYKRPAELAPFDRGPRNILSLNDVMPNHIPQAKELTEEERRLAQQNMATRARVGGRRNLLDESNEFFQLRKAEKATFDADLTRETFFRSFHRAGKSAAGHDLHTDLADIFRVPSTETPITGQRGPFTVSSLSTSMKRSAKVAAAANPTLPGMPFARRLAENVVNTQRGRELPPEIEALVGAKPGREASAGQQLFADFAGAGSLGKAALFWNPLPHVRNIGTLLALANPAAIPGAVRHFARTGAGFASPATRVRLGQQAMRAGAMEGPHTEQQILPKALESFGARFGIPGKALAGGLSKAYEGSSKILWGWDEAARQGLFERELKHYGGNARLAAASVQRKLVNYSMPSEAARLARTVMPFATWTTGAPQAFLRSLFEHPEYPLSATRATSGIAAGAPFTVGGQQYQMTNPMAKFNRASSSFKNFARFAGNELGLTPTAIIDLLRPEPGTQSQKQIQEHLPVVGQALDLAGKSPYGDTAAQEWLNALIGVYPSKAGIKPPKKRHRRGRRWESRAKEHEKLEEQMVY